MAKGTILTFILMIMSATVFGQFFSISGKVTNTSIEPIENVNIKVRGSVYGTATDANGNYVLQLEKGTFELIFTYVGYHTIKKNITITQNVTLNTILEEDISVINEVELTTKRIDRSREIVREVIRSKNKYLETSYSCNMYIKSIQEADEMHRKVHKDSLARAIKKWQKDSLLKLEESDSSSMAFKKKAKLDSLERIAAEDTSSKAYKKRIKNIKPINPLAGINIDLAEIIIEKSFEYPDKVKEVRSAYKKKGDVSGLFYLSSTEGEFNFYQNLVRISSLSESPFQSPLSNGGLLAYKYKLVKSSIQNGLKVYTIRVSPNAVGNALVSGEMEVIDSLWCLKSYSFTFPQFHLAEYDYFKASASFSPDSNGLWMCDKQEFIFKTKLGGARSSGKTTVFYSNYVTQKFSKRYFNNELSSTSQDAYEKDSAFWNTRRKEPLTAKEVRFIYVSDSIKAAHEKKEYLDSVDKVLNKLTLSKIVLFGQVNYNREKERTLAFDPLWIVVNPMAIGGVRIRYGLGIYKKFKNKTTLNSYTNLSYGLLNQDVKGNGTISRLYNPIKQAYWNISAKRNFDVINPFDSWLNVFRRANFYVSTGVRAFHRIELSNGLYLITGLEFARRASISNYKFTQAFDSVYDNYKNRPASFEDYNTLYSNLTLSYTPFQKYLREPHEKIILGSRYPTFIVDWRKGIPNILGSKINFDYLEYRIEWDFKIGLVGNSKLYVSSGKFYNKKSLQFIDYKYQNRIGPVFFANPLYSFQALDSSYVTLNRFYAAHYFHRFNGAILNKIPGLKLLKLNESGGGGLLYSKEHHLFYVELFAGIDKQFVLFSERARIGIYAVQAISNNFKAPLQFKFTLDFYDRVENRWTY